MTEKMLGLVAPLLLLICAVHGAYEKDTYALVMPKLVRPGTSFDISVIIFNAPSAVSTTGVIMDMDNQTLATGSGTFSVGAPGILSIMVPRPLKMTKVQVEVRLGSGLNKVNRTEADVKQKTLSFFVQTDKSKYKPGQTVKFRALAVYSDLLPYLGLMNVTVLNRKGSRVQQFLNQSQPTGVISKELSLSAETDPGVWKIMVEANGEKMEKTFEIAEYVLPKFEVSVDLPPFITKWDTGFKTLIQAKYTFGQIVKGMADITFRIKPYSRWDRSIYRVIRKSMQMDKGKAEFDISDITQLSPTPQRMYPSYDPRNALAGRTIEINATVTEALTGKKINTTEEIRIEQNKFKLEFLDIMADNFKLGMDYNVMLKLTLADGSPPQALDLVSNGRRKVVKVTFTQNFKYSGTYRQPESVESSWTFPSSGLLQFTKIIPVNRDNIDTISFRAIFPNSTTASKYNIKMFESRDKQGMQLSMPESTGTVKAGDKVKFQVNSTNALNHFFYQIFSKGELVVSQQYRPVNASTKKYTLVVDLTEQLARQLAPNARIIAWSLSSGEITTDSLDFTVDGIFANKVSLGFNTNQTKPAQQVELEVRADPNSAVFVLAVDQSVKLLGGGNDFDESMVSAELEKYDSTKNDHSYPFPGPMLRGRRKRSIMPWLPVSTGGSDSWEIFDNAGVIVLSDAYIHKKAPEFNRHVYMFAAPMPDGRFDGQPGLHWPLQASRPMAAPRKPPNDRAKYNNVKKKKVPTATLR